jgi:hypothetical protein
MIKLPGDESLVGICWYQRETYDACLLLFSDPDNFPDSFDDWVIWAEQTEKDLTERGANVIRVETDPKALLLWCNERGYPDIDTNARQAFAAIKARERFNSF